MDKKLLTVSALLIALVLLVVVNVLGGATLGSARADLTANGLFTLSKGASRILANMEEPVTLRFYFSRKLSTGLPQIMSHAQRVEALLNEFEAESGGKIRLEVYDPEPFSETEDRAIGYGLRGVPVGEGEILYFGLVGTNSTDDSELVPFFQPDKEEFLEYDLAKLVYTLTTPRKQVLGVLSTLPIEGEMPNMLNPRAQTAAPWFFMDQLRKIYSIRSIMPGSKEIPEDVDILLLIHPKNLSDEMRYSIDQFVLRGGPALVFVDSFCEADEPPPDPSNQFASLMAPRDSNLPGLFEKWGIALKSEKIAGDRISAIKVPAQNRGREEYVDYVVFLDLSPERLARNEVVTSNLEQITMGMPGILERLPDATTEFVPLIKTSPESMDIDTAKVRFRTEPQELLAGFFADNQERVLAARLSGPAKTAFPEGRPHDPAEDDPSMVVPDEKKPQLMESTGINVVVVADADMLQDRFWVQVQNLGNMRLGIPRSDNGPFVVNALEFLQGSTDLISLRGRGGSKRPFKVVEELEHAAELRFRSEEQRLTGELEKAEQRINELQSKKVDGTSLILSPEQQTEIERIREEQVHTRKELRNVRHELRKDIENLGTWLKVLNIGLIPILIVVLAIWLYVYKAFRRKSPVLAQPTP